MKQFLTSEQIEILNKEIKFSFPPSIVSLGNLLEILPEAIYHEGKEYSRIITRSIIQYCYEEEGECLEIIDKYETCKELIDNLFHTCLSLKDTGLLNTGSKELSPICTKTRKDINVSNEWDGWDDDYSTNSLNQSSSKLNIINLEEEFIDDRKADLIESCEDLDEGNITEPVKVDKGIYILPENFLNTTEEDYKRIKGKCFIRELGEFIVVRVEDLVSPQYSEFLYEQYDKYSDGSWNCKDYNWLQNKVDYDPEYRKYCLTDQTDMNVGSEEMYCLGKDGNLYVTLECGDEWLRFIPFDSDKFEKIKEEALRNFKEENGYDL